MYITLSPIDIEPRNLGIRSVHARDVSQDLQVEVTGAVSYYFVGHSLKIQGDYTNIHKQVAGKQATDDKQMRVQAQVTF